MSALAPLAALALLAGPPAPPAPRPPPLTLERIVSRSPALFGTAPTSPAWSRDGKRLAFLWSSLARPEREVWLVDRDGTVPRRLSRSAEEGGEAVAELAWGQGDALLVLAGGRLLRLDAAVAGPPVELVAAAGDRSVLTVSPDGRTAAYLEGGDLWLLPLAGGAPVQATHLAVKPIGAVAQGTYFAPDVEVGGAEWGEGAPAYAWAPDGASLALQVVDRRGVRRFPIPHYLTPDAILNEVRRGAPGDENERRTVALLDLATLALQPLELEEPSRWAVLSLAWSSRGHLLIDRATDDGVDRALAVVDRPSLTPRVVWRDHGERRIYPEVAAAWHPDGERLLLTGDLEERLRLYLLTPGDAAPRPLTGGPFDVAGAALAGPGWPWVYYVSGEPRPEERQVWRIPAEGGPAVRVSPLHGSNRPFVSPDGRAVALLHTDDAMPTELFLGDRRLTYSPPPDFAATRWAAVRYATVPGSTAGIELHLRILEQPDLDRRVRHPVVFGPVYTNTVRDRWEPRWSGLQQLLVQRGFIVVQVDSRGSTGYGRAFREKFLLEWGQGDLDDYQDAAAFMKSRPWVDPARVGVFGSSYGGLVTVFALLRRPGLFAAGVACAPATDPSYFGSDDVAVTRSPRTHPQVFEQRRAALLAGNLQDPLLLIHGMADDVVPFQTSVVLAQALVKQHKDFDFAFTATATHRWAARPDDALYLYGKLVGHLERWLAPRRQPGAPRR
jgi:dipeptidyl-peptidase-4